MRRLGGRGFHGRVITREDLSFCFTPRLALDCLRLSVAVINAMAIDTLTRRGLISALMSDHSPYFREVRVGTQGMNLETETEAEAMEEHHLLALLNLLPSST